MTAHTTARRALAAIWAHALTMTLAIALALQCAGGARAQAAAPTAAAGNAIEAISANQQGANVIVKITLKDAPAQAPISFAISNPPRVVLDLGATANATGKTALELNQGELRSVNVVQAGQRSRLVFNLKRALNYAVAIDGKAVILTIDGTGGVATAVDANGLPAARAATPASAATSAL
ncbi:AMIN domain-containing protein, partial [Duganella callida]